MKKCQTGESFSDRTLVDIASRLFRNDDDLVGGILKKRDLTTTERNNLLKYIYEAQISKPKSMREMRIEILGKIEYQDQYHAMGGSIDRKELEAIHRYIMRT